MGYTRGFLCRLFFSFSPPASDDQGRSRRMPRDAYPPAIRIAAVLLASLVAAAALTATAVRPLAHPGKAAARRQLRADDAARRRLLADGAGERETRAGDLKSWDAAEAANPTPLARRALARILRAAPAKQPAARPPTKRMSATAAAATFTRLHENLLEGYDIKAGPGNPTNVTVAVYLQRMGEINPGQGSLEVSVLLVLAWHDPRLVWTPADYDNVTETALSIVPETYNDGDLWFPDFDLRDGESILPSLAAHPAALYHDGTIVWTRMGKAAAGCTFSGLREFPFDTLECTLRFGGMARSRQLVNYELLAVGGDTAWALTVNPDIVSSETFHENWISNYTISEAAFGSEEAGDAFKDIAVYVRLKRGITGYIIVMFFPNFFLGFLSTVIYAINNGSGERISVCVTLLLAEVASVLFVADKILFNELISTMDVFYMLVLSFTVVALLQSFWSVSIYYGNFQAAPSWFVTMKLKAVEVAHDPSTWVGNYTIDKVRSRARQTANKLKALDVASTARALSARILRVFADARIRVAKEQLKATEAKSAPLKKFRTAGRVVAAEAAILPGIRGRKSDEDPNSPPWSREDEMALRIQRAWRAVMARTKIRRMTEELRRRRAVREDFNASRGLTEIGMELSKRLDMQFLYAMPPIYIALVAVLIADHNALTG